MLCVLQIMMACHSQECEVNSQILITREHGMNVWRPMGNQPYGKDKNFCHEE